MKFLVAFVVIHSSGTSMSSAIMKLPAGHPAVTEYVLHVWEREIHKWYTELNNVVVRILSFQVVHIEAK